MRHFTLLALVGVVIMALPAAGLQASNPVAVLQHTRDRLLEDLDHWPRYTCVQTITRTYYDARSGAHGSSCSALVAARDARQHRLRPFLWDRLRLEVAWIYGTNLFSWIGSPQFAEDNLEQLAGSGPLGSGDFGVLLREILLRSILNFQREEIVSGKRLLKYSYEMPLDKSTYKVRTADGWTTAAYTGTLFLDPEMMDLVKLTLRTSNLRSGPSCEVDNEITYHRISIHDRFVLIPSEARLDVLNASGTESLSQSSFENCREFKARFRLLTDESKSTARTEAVVTPTTASPSPLPEGLEFSARITTPIDSDTAAAGDPVEAILLSPIHGTSKSLIAPKGTRIHGRLTEISWRSQPVSNYTVTLRFEFMEIEGRKIPISAVLEPPHPKVLTGTNALAQRPIVTKKNDMPGGTFSFGAEHLRLSRLDARWITVAAVQ